MTGAWPTVPLWALVTEVRQVVEPSILGERVFHYSIPTFYAVGGGIEEFSGEIKSAKQQLHGGELLISKLNPRKSRVVTIQKHPLPIVASTEFVGMRPSGRTDGRYLSYVLSSDAVRQELDSMVESVTRSHQRVSPEEIMRLNVPLPPLQEQRRIADFLDTEVARIDALMAARGRQIDRLQDRGRSVISETLIPGVVAKSVQRAPWTWLPVMEDDRPLVRLGYVAQVQSGITVDAARDLSGNVVTRPYLRVANVQAGHLDLDAVTEVTVPASIARRSTLRVGDVLMTEGGDLDKLGRGAVWAGEIEDCLHQNHVFAIRPDVERLDGQYLTYMTQSIHGRCYFESTGSQTTNLASTNSNKISGFPIPLPPVRRQRELVRELRSRLGAISAAEALLRRQLSLLEERRQALITAAIVGQIDVAKARGVGVS
jgi:type I restriction enzyme S subunit